MSSSMIERLRPPIQVYNRFKSASSLVSLLFDVPRLSCHFFLQAMRMSM